MTSSDDLLTAQRLRAGERAEFERLFRGQYAPLCSFVARLVGSPDLAEELVQETFLRLWADRTTLEVHTSLRAFLYAAARNRALNHLKRVSLETRWSAEEALRSDVSEVLPEALHALERAEVRQRVQAEVSKLPPRLRETVELRWGRQWSHAEIAEAMGISVKAVEANVARARAALKPALAPFID